MRFSSRHVRFGFTRLQSLAYTADMQVRPPRRDSAIGASIDEAHTRQSQKMEVVGQLASGFAHDLRHILSVIIGNLELLMIRHAADADDRTALGRAMDAATHGVAVIQSMMHFVRKTAPNPKIVDLNDVINSTMLHQAVGSRIALVQMPATFPTLVKVDQTQLELALLNIALNARDAMPNGGTVTIVTQTVTLNGEHGLTGDYSSVAIRDTGTGIPPDVLENVLTPFFTTKTKEEGTGLGLSMVDCFAKEYQGAVAIDSVVGKGTTVTIFLPTPCHSCKFQPTCESRPMQAEQPWEEASGFCRVADAAHLHRAVQVQATDARASLIASSICSRRSLALNGLRTSRSKGSPAIPSGLA